MHSLLSFLALGASLWPLAQAVPAPSPKVWQDWQKCTPENTQVRVDFASMPPHERKSYTDAIRCIMSKPSSLDRSTYPAALNRYLDYAVIHVGKTPNVHLSGFFLTWHRYYLWLFEHDLRSTCGYTGRFPYWNFAETAGDIHNNPVFDGSEYSMSGDGEFVDAGPIVFGPALTVPHGTGGGCVTTGPFGGLQTTLGFIDPKIFLSGGVPQNPYVLNVSCLTRDLNQYVSQTYTNQAQVQAASQAGSALAFEDSLNGRIGGNTLGIHSGGHFSVGGVMDSVHVSPQDPIWFPLHTYIDLVYHSWQVNHPELASDLSGTETANNVPPSANVTLDTIEPDWGYFDTSAIPVRDLISTTAGPFCYTYDKLVS